MLLASCLSDGERCAFKNTLLQRDCSVAIRINAHLLALLLVTLVVRGQGSYSMLTPSTPPQ